MRNERILFTHSFIQIQAFNTCVALVLTKKRMQQIGYCENMQIIAHLGMYETNLTL